VLFRSIAGRIFDSNEYIDAAIKSYEFIHNKLFNEKNILLHRYRNGSSNIYGNLDDYAFLIWASIELYQSTFEPYYIAQSVRLTEHTIKHFGDKEFGGFYLTPDYGEKLIVRTKEIYDGAIPSGNSVMFSNLLRLSRITANNKFEEYASKLLDTFSESVNRAPSGSTYLLSYLDFYWGNSYEIIISSSQVNEAVENIIMKLYQNFIPNKIVVARYDPLSPPFNYLKNYSSKEGTPLIYVCKNFTCELPIINLTNLEGLERYFNPGDLQG